MGFPSPGESRGHKFRDTNYKGLLQNVSFAAVLFLPSVAVSCCVYGVKEQPVVDLRLAKLTGKLFTVRLWIFPACNLL